MQRTACIFLYVDTQCFLISCVPEVSCITPLVASLFLALWEAVTVQPRRREEGAVVRSPQRGIFTHFKLDLEKAEEPEIKLPTSAGSLKKREFQKNIYFCFIDYAKAFDCVDHNKLWKILKEMGIQKTERLLQRIRESPDCHRDRHCLATVCDLH